MNFTQITIISTTVGKKPLEEMGSHKCSPWVQSQRQQNDLCSFPSQIIQQIIQHRSNPSYTPTSNGEEAEVERFYEDLQDLLELAPKKDVLFLIGDWNAKVRSRDTWSNRQIWPWSAE